MAYLFMLTRYKIERDKERMKEIKREREEIFTLFLALKHAEKRQPDPRTVRNKENINACMSKQQFYIQPRQDKLLTSLPNPHLRPVRFPVLHVHAFLETK